MTEEPKPIAGDPPTRLRSPTLRDVARQASVDTSTVSKVLKGRGILVREETRDRILRAVDDLGYRPNAMARNLRLRRPEAFGLLLPDITNPVYASIVRGAMRKAEELGISLLMAELADKDPESSYARLVKENRIGGLLIANARRDAAQLRALERHDVPHVFVNRRAGGASAPFVVVDDEGGAALAARALAERGHRQIAIVAGPEEIDTAQRRLAGFFTEADRLGLPEPHMERGSFNPAGGYEATVRLLRACPRPTGIFVSNFYAAIGALRGARDAGFDVPAALSMVSFDDANLADHTMPPLTTIWMPLEEMGSASVSALAAVVAGAEAPNVVVATAPRLIERGSIMEPRADGS